MKKVIITLVLLATMVLCLLSMVSCSDTLDKVKNFKMDDDTLTLSWDRVLGAKNYSISVSGQSFEKSTKQNSISLEYLEPGTYEIKVKANSDSSEVKSSDWATYTFVREKESGLKYKLINNKTEYQLVGLGTAAGDVVMDDTYRGKPVTQIADKAFSGNSKLTTFVVGKNVKTIGNSAFSRCSELTSITMSDSVTSIGASCFQSCKKLESFAFPNSITVIEDYMFSWCSSLKTVTVGNATTTLSTYAFSNCKSLEKIIFPDTLTIVEEYAFSDCESLTEANLGNSVEVIQPYSFYNCIAMTTLNIGTSLKEIGEYAFGNCDSISSIKIPETCESIGLCAFRYCDQLAEVEFLGRNIKYIAAGVFYNTPIYQNAENELVINGWYLNCKNQDATAVNIPSDVYAIADSAFYKCEGLVTVDLRTKNSIKYICNSAFYGCKALTYIFFNDSLETIGAYAFKDCKELQNIALGSNLKSIGDYAFSGCTKLKDDEKYVKLPDSLTSIGVGAFKGTKATIKENVAYFGKWAVGVSLGQTGAVDKIVIRDGTKGISNYAFEQVPILQADLKTYGIYIPDSVEYIGRGAFYKSAAFGYAVTVKLPAKLKSIGDYAFYGCYCAFFGSNKELIIPESTEYIGRSAFYGCESIYSLAVPGSVQEIGPFAFYGCVNMGTDIVSEDETVDTIEGFFTLAEGIQSIGEKAFYKCSGIKEIVIPDSVTSIGSRAFYKCESLKSLTIGSGLTAIPDYAFYSCTLLESLIIPDGVISIGQYAFRGCTSLKVLSLGNTVKEIGKFAFFGAENLTALVIPDSVTTIGMHAFRGMTRIKSIIIPSSVKTIDAHAFYGAVISIIYIEEDEIPETWNVRWNSSYVPTVVGCTLSEDGTYVVSFVKTSDNPDNLPIDEQLYNPARSGYEFLGFATTNGGSDVVYTMSTLKAVPAGTTLYTVWAPLTTQDT